MAAQLRESVSSAHCHCSMFVLELFTRGRHKAASYSSLHYTESLAKELVAIENTHHHYSLCAHRVQIFKPIFVSEKLQVSLVLRLIKRAI